MLPAFPAGASVDRASALHAYARGRLADDDGASGLALQSYRAALDAEPDSLAVARRSYSQALLSGDMMLAMRSAQLLDREGLLPRDGTLLFLCEAFGRRDWPAARRLTDRMIGEGNFSFLAPVILSWIAAGEGRREPPVIDGKDRFASLGQRYVDEHAAVQALADGKVREAEAAINRALALRTAGVAPLRLAFAAQFVARGAKPQALALLPDEDADYSRAKQDVIRGRFPAGYKRVETPGHGLGRLLSRLATDISSDSSTRVLGIRLARMAVFVAPEDAGNRLALAQLLVQAGFWKEAATEARKIPADGWFGSLAQGVLVDALSGSRDSEGAIKLATSLAQQPGADAERHVRLGRLLAQAKQFGPAAEAFRTAQSRYAADAVPWALLLFEGSALEQAGRWDEARTVLERAARMAPDEPIVLNYLGYAQVERRQNVDAALQLLKRASLLKPDDPAIADSLGWAQFVTGDVEAAVPVLERAAEGAPADATINEHLGDALWAAGRRYEARYAWRAAAVFAEGAVAERLQAKSKEGMKPEYAAP
jgi:Flp pilus assembly protein TadD